MQTRNVGIDAARAVALVAMMVAHLTVQEGITAQVLFGFPAALFAFIAGVSMGYMRAQPAEFIVRGILLIALHFALAPFSGSIVVVLGTIGVCMALLAWAPRWDTPLLLWLACALTFGSAVLAPSSWPYPPMMWATLMIAGILFKRYMPLWPGLVVGGALFALDVALRWTTPLPPLLDATGHTGGLMDVVGSVGASISICALCCLAQRWLGWLAPLGRMPLTLYCIHVLTAEWLNVWVTVGGAIVIAYVWLAIFQRGPLETVIRRITAVVKENNREKARS
ncbi:DUF418 domain-containing protein [Corynebacterium striatum]|uniref:DUF418 domain-containing protein n=4 Tax=Corynebacterium TaxID=1716 RepID=A0AB37G918_CORAY|nr:MULTISPECIES: hypothetical protein [Corynebacterium]HCT9181647.1 DUF418 domain-containing protein [Corynebacterium aurimucosum]ART20697.1 DUF418 domain-containing protein [Corynebacterium striatum]ATZ06396.1 DUF418 domain-containing protein [Corynebacterium striatum]ATZ09214.1 DUF418 domain-containing protein [Corynebacterium striatum]EGT5592790.1 DUF418 domain-containing protein [Corynebacterium striatum]